MRYAPSAGLRAILIWRYGRVEERCALFSQTVDD
jgi:hypothetical protein